MYEAASRTNPFSDPVREITVRIETGKVLRILSSDLDAPAAGIADPLQAAMGHRTVFPMGQISHFLDNSENAVRTRIAVALIAYLVLQLAMADQKTIKSPLAFARLVRANIMHKRRTDQLKRPPPEQTQSDDQMVFLWA